MKPLRLTVPLGEQETPASFASRLAARNGLTAREFCHDWEFRFQAVVDGNAEAIAAIARLGGVDPTALAASAFVKCAKQNFEHRGERLIRRSLRRSRVHVCPACLLDDIRSHPKLASELAVHNRAAWMIDAIQTCAVHDAGLVQVADEVDPHKIHDFAQLAAQSLPRLGRLAARAPRRRPTGLENYIMARLAGEPQSAFLDSLPLYAAVHTCEVIGAIDVFGRRVNLQRLRDDDWLRAGAAGFKIASGGPEAIDAFLAKLQNTYRRNGWEGPPAVFGQLHQWLAFFARDHAYDAVRNVVARHIRAHHPVGPGDRIFGVTVSERTLHSICTLSVESGLHPERLRKILRAADVIDDRQMALVDNLVLFDAERAAQVVRRSASALSLPAAAKRMNSPIKQIRLLAENDFIKPFLPARALSVRDRYAIEDLDVFLDKLLDGAKTVRRPTAGMADIPTATRRTSCSTAAIVQLILDRKLSWTGKAAGRRGYLSVLVDVDEIRAKVPRTDYGGVTKFAMMRRLHTTHAVLDALIAHRHLTVIPATNPVNRHQRIVIAPEECARFEHEYVSLCLLAEEQGKHFTAVRKALQKRGVEPAFDRKKIGATFYRRREVQVDKRRAA